MFRVSGYRAEGSIQSFEVLFFRIRVQSDNGSLRFKAGSEMLCSCFYH